MKFPFHPLSANAEHTSHGGDVTCSSCSAAYKQNSPRVFERGENFYKIVYYTFYLSKANRQKSCYKV